MAIDRVNKADGKADKSKPKARDVATEVEGSDRTLKAIDTTGKSDAYKYQYAVDLAKQDLGGDLSNTDEALHLIDEYYAQMDPGTSAADMRGETAFTQAVRAVGEGVDNVNDVLGDGIDWLWDNTAGNLAGALGGLLGAFSGDKDMGEKWKQGVSDVVSEDTADAIANMGTGMLVAAIPGIGVPLAAGLTAAQNSDELYEAISGRDAITRERLSDLERIGRGGAAVLDTVLAAAPAVGKLGRTLRGAGATDDAIAAGRAAKKAALKAKASNSGDYAKLRQQASDIGRNLGKMRAGGEVTPELASAIQKQRASARPVAGAVRRGNASTPSSDLSRMSQAIKNLRASASRSPLNPVNQLKVAAGDVAGTGRNIGRLYREQKLAPLPSSTNLKIGTAVDTALPKAAKQGAKAAAKEAGEKATKNDLGEAAKNLAKSAGLGAVNMAKSVPANGIMGGIVSGVPLSLLNYMGETGDMNLATVMKTMANPMNIMMAVSPGMLRHAPGVRNLYGKLGLQGMNGAGSPAASVRARGIGNNIQDENDEAYGDDFYRRLASYGGE